MNPMTTGVVIMALKIMSPVTPLDETPICILRVRFDRWIATWMMHDMMLRAVTGIGMLNYQAC